MQPPFVIFALPRSRTAWLSTFLSYGGWHCGHDELRRMRGLDDVKSWLAQPMTGTVETAGAPWWRLLVKYRPDTRVLVVRRPVGEVVDSMFASGLFSDRTHVSREIERLDAKLDQVERRVPNVLSIRFDELATEWGCAAAFRHCLGLYHDREWWSSLASVNIQHSMPAMIRYAAAHAPQLAKLAAFAKHESLVDLKKRPVVVPGGVLFQEEAFADWYRDAQQLFNDHLIQVEEIPDASVKNLALAQACEQRGDLQIATARSNGRMFGYLMTILSPSLESPDLRSAIHTTFYASPDIPGLGLKLQRYALERLRAKSLGEVWWRAGPRGDGPRMGILFQRLGGLPSGQLYRLDLRSG